MSAANGIGPAISRAEREEALERQREEQRQQQNESAARSLVSRAAAQQGTAAPGYWEMLADPDLDHPAWGDSVEAFTQAELSRAFALGNITREHWEDLRLRNENEFWQIQNEMRGPKTKLADDDMRLLYGEERADLDDSAARRLRAAREVKNMILSLSIDRAGLRSGTEIHGVVRSEDGSEPDEESGTFGRLGKYLGG